MPRPAPFLRREGLVLSVRFSLMTLDGHLHLVVLRTRIAIGIGNRSLMVSSLGADTSPGTSAELGGGCWLDTFRRLGTSYK